MEITLLSTHGLHEALYGLGKSFGKTSNINFIQFNSRRITYDKMYKVALRLAPLGRGHNKFLEHIDTYWEIKGTREWWSHMDTYRVGISKQSESTMHTIKKRLLTPDDFNSLTDHRMIDIINEKIIAKASVAEIKANLAEGFYQTRECKISLNQLIHIYIQRYNHKLPDWPEFVTKSFKILPKQQQKFILTIPELKTFLNGV